MAKDRAGPTKSATLFAINTVKKGIDGKYWIVNETKNNTHKWKKINNSEKLGKKNSLKNNTKFAFSFIKIKKMRLPII